MAVTVIHRLERFKLFSPEGALILFFAGLVALPLFQGGLFQHGLLVDGLAEVYQLMHHPIQLLSSRPFWHWPDPGVWLLALCRLLPWGGQAGWVMVVSYTTALIAALGMYQWTLGVTRHRWASILATVALMMQWGVLRVIPSNVAVQILMALTVWMMVWLTVLSQEQGHSAMVRHKNSPAEKFPFWIGVCWFLTLFCGGVRVFLATGLLLGGYALSHVRTARDATFMLHKLGVTLRLTSLLFALMVVLSFAIAWVVGPTLGIVMHHIGQWWVVHFKSVLLLFSIPWWHNIALHAWADFGMMAIRTMPVLVFSLILWVLWRHQRPYCRRLPDCFVKGKFLWPWLLGGLLFSAWFPAAVLLFFPLLIGVLVSVIPHDLSLPLWIRRLWDGVMLLILMLAFALVLVLAYGSILPTLDQEALLHNPVEGWPLLGGLSWKGGLVLWVVISMVLVLGLFAWSSKARFRGALASVMLVWCWLFGGLYGVVFPVFSRPMDVQFTQAGARFLDNTDTLLVIDDGMSTASLTAWFPRLIWTNLSSDYPMLSIQQPEDWSTFWLDRVERANRRVMAVMRESTYYQLPTLMRHQSKVLSSSWGWKPELLVGQRAAYSGLMPVNLLHYIQGVRSLDRWLLVVYWPKRYAHLDLNHIQNHPSDSTD